MSSIVHSLSDLVQSLVEVVWSFFTTAAHLVQNTLSFAANFFASILNVVIEFFKGLVDLAGGIASFVLGTSQSPSLPPETWESNLMRLGNIVILLVLAVAFFGFLQYQRSQGNAVKVGNKKLN